MGSNEKKKRIVIGVDGSANSQKAIAWAVDNAHSGDTLVLLTGWHPVIPPPEMAVAYSDDDTSMRTVLEQETVKARKLAEGTGLNVESKFAHVDPRTALMDEACDLIVIGSRGHSGIAGLLLGSTTDYVARHSNVPVVIVRVK